jgi:hypothetical protein
MDELTHKYRMNNLSPEELKDLRGKINDMSDDELEAVIYDDWMSENTQVDNVDIVKISRIKNSIDNRINRVKLKPSYIFRIIQIAAAILLPIFIVSTFYLYRENNQMLSDDMIVATGKGERASIVLPDGTEVTLNYESKIVYTPKVYNKQERKIRFDGEGYFKVSKDRRHPFVIDAKGLQVNVLGTAFNLSARSNDLTAELILEEGSVRLLSVMTGKNVLLKPNQKATLDYHTGTIIVENSPVAGDAAAWRKGDLVFRNEKLEVVLKTLEDNYDYQIKIDCENCLKDVFTGTLSISDINEVLEVLERVYHLKATVKGKEILLQKER